MAIELVMEQVNVVCERRVDTWWLFCGPGHRTGISLASILSKLVYDARMFMAGRIAVENP
jgi:hypothetical protein